MSAQIQLLTIADEPTGLHLDAWGGILVASALVLAVSALAIRSIVGHGWPHHPFRVTMRFHMANALLGCVVTVALVGVSHLLGWPVYGLPVVGDLALLLSAGVSVWLTLDWWTSLRPALKRYEDKYPAITRANAESFPRVRPSESNAPMLWALGSAVVAYGAFVWHPWPHIFHEGNFLYGAPVGFAIGSLVAMHTTAVSGPIVAPIGASRQKATKRRK